LVLRLPGHYDSAQRLNLALDHAVAFDFKLNTMIEPNTRAPGANGVSLSSGYAADASATATATAGPSPWPWIALAGSAASLLTAGTFELLREGAERRAKSQTTQIEYSRAFDDAETHQRNARIFAGVGGGLALTGVVLLLALRPEVSERRNAAFACDTQGCFGSLASEF
jgi:hypothetical protein